MNMATLHFTQENFKQDVLESDKPVLVDFWATWCGPCRMIAPIVEQLAQEYDGRAKVGKVDVDENPDIARQYGVQSIPTLAVIKGGQVVSKVVGAYPKPRIAEMLDNALK
jgi:thioredoxin 1